jgi:predicted metal-dependent peptidase
LTTTLTAEEKIKKVRIDLLRKTPFFGYLALHLRPRAVDEKICDTAGVNINSEMVYSEKFVNSLSEDELKTVLCHETCHLAFETIARCKSRHHKIFNYASDYAINLVLEENGFRMPKDILLDAKFKGMCAEEIYEKIKKNFKEIKIFIGLDVDFDTGDGKSGSGGGKSDKNGKGKMPTFKEGDGKGKDEKEENGEGNGEIKAEDWKELMAEAHHFAKAQGKTPAGMDRFFEDALYPKASWRQLLYKYISNTVLHDYSFNVPNRRFIHSGIYLPSQVKESIDIIMACDTSGSISPQDLTDFYNEMLSIRDSFANVKLTVITCDAQIHEIIEVQNHEPLEIKMKGGGGTSLIPPFKWVEENKPTAKILVYLTDLMGDFPNYVPRVQTIWCVQKDYEKTKVPFGDIITIE